MSKGGRPIDNFSYTVCEKQSSRSGLFFLSQSEVASGLNGKGCVQHYGLIRFLNTAKQLSTTSIRNTQFSAANCPHIASKSKRTPLDERRAASTK